MRNGTVSRRAADGFTLLELVVGLAVGGLVLVSASTAVSALATAASVQRKAAEALDRSSNAERVLRHLTTNLRIGDDSVAVAGDHSSVDFHSWCDAPGPTLVSCSVTLTILHGPEGPSVVLRWTPEGGARETESASWPVPYGRIRYLVDAAHGGRWADSWQGTSPPLGVALLAGGDTILLPMVHR